jgi:hypothetical protein
MHTQKGNTLVLVLVLLVVGGVLGFFAAKYLINKPDNKITISSLVPKKDLILTEKNLFRVYTVCPGTREYLILWASSINYKLNLQDSNLEFIWSGNDLTVNAPAIEMVDKVSVYPNSKKSWALNKNILVNDTAAMEKEKDKAESLALYYGYKALVDGEIQPTFEKQFKSLIENIALGMGKSINSIKVNFKAPEAQVYSEPTVEYCSDGNAVNFQI